MLQINRPCGTFCVAQTVAFTQNRVDDGLLAQSCLAKFDGAIGAGSDTGATSHTGLLIDFAHRTGDGNGIMGKKCQGPTGSTVSLVDRFRYMLGVMRHAAQINTFGTKLNRSEFDMGFFEKFIRTQRDLELLSQLPGSGGGNYSGRQGQVIGIDGQLLTQYGIGHGYPQDRPAL